MNRAELEAKGTSELRKLVREIPDHGLTGLQIVNLKKQECIELLMGNKIVVEETAEVKAEAEEKDIEFPPKEKEIETPKSENQNNDLAKLIAESIAPFVNAKTSVDEKQVSAIVRAETANILNRIDELEKVKQIEISIKTEKQEYKINGAVHEAFYKLLGLLQCRTLLDMPLPILLVGGAGSSKTSTVAKVAEVLGLQFYMNSCTDSITPSMFFGYHDTQGKYVRTMFREAYENGGVYLLDEFDAGNSNAVLAINSALANGECGFPDGMIKRHKDFVCIASANTFGRGESGEYCGRNQLDSATLDRFVVLPFNYDPKFEIEIATGIKQGRSEEEIRKYEPVAVSNQQAIDFVKQIQAYRKRIEELHVKFIISPRASIYGVAMMKHGFSMQEIETMVVFKGLSNDLVSKIRN